MSLHRITRFAGRPLLLTPDAALQLATRALAVDAGALRHARLARSPGKFMSKLGIASLFTSRAMEDDDDFIGESAPTRPLGYAPFYAGAPEHEGFCWSLVEGIACMDIEGALLDRGCVSVSGETFWGYDTVAQALKEACADSRVRGVFMRVNSPGGVVAGGLEALTADMRSLRQTSNTNGKPIFAYADCAASAAYWIASQCDRIFAPPVGTVGSIGAVIVHEDWSEAAAKAGVKVTPIQFGAKKTDGAWFKALSEQALADLQSEIDAIGHRFVADVVAGREFLSRDALIGTQAACFMAANSDPERSGIKLGLVDEISREDAAFAALKAHVAGVKPASQPVSAKRRAPAPASVVQTDSNPGAQTETDEMRTKNSRIEAVLSRKAMTADEKLDAIQSIIDEETDDAAAEGEDEEVVAEGEEEETTAETEEEETTAEGEEEEPAAEGEEEEPKAKAALARAKAIIALPEARGREALAQKLAFTPGMKVATAKDLLAAAPKASKLNVHDPKLGAAGDAVAAGKSADEKAASFIIESAAAARGKPRKTR